MYDFPEVKSKRRNHVSTKYQKLLNLNLVWLVCNTRSGYHDGMVTPRVSPQCSSALLWLKMWLSIHKTHYIIRQGEFSLYFIRIIWKNRKKTRPTGHIILQDKLTRKDYLLTHYHLITFWFPSKTCRNKSF